VKEKKKGFAGSKVHLGTEKREEPPSMLQDPPEPIS
jgi:hypothetical protein